ncbi:isochorismatase domain-containing protein [Aspergillus sclerotioniger CBS 115572]|uniref:Isochorismatase domain-containing protein n=1 Tax=Aspergillus sclerotioniger CBS 115572 TaxID=1450535 RepID=A0A317X3P5_9EURO|nr:isochorismatase domain-containing protein [Aspergillus sclerotioniger CBS 115572]PWY93193.1 isochorismatase domain-containing protein [Aspergillus sclerotioniger CBS 115572]
MATLSRVTRICNPALFICDLQEKFRHAIYEFSKVSVPIPSPDPKTNNIQNNHNHQTPPRNHPLNIPIYITTQSRNKLGPTVPELTALLSPPTPNIIADIDKTLFSMITPEIDALLPAQPLDVLLVGIETHICVTQTTLDLLARGHRVYVIVDGVSSVNKDERGVAIARLRDAGAIVTTSESVLFEILGDAKHQAFRAVSGVVKEMKEETRGRWRVWRSFESCVWIDRCL